MGKELELMLEDFIEIHKEINLQNISLRIYEDCGNKNFQWIFGYFHQILNELFTFMNHKSKINNHYNANESRYLLKIIDELKRILKITNNTEYNFILEKNYIDKINESQSFLRSYWGSYIPDTYKELEIIKYKPIFHFTSLEHKLDLRKDKNIKTEANYNDDNTISITLKQELFSHIKKLLENWHYHNTVEESYKIVREKLKSITWTEKAHEWFKESNYQIIFWHNPINDTEKDFFEWVKFLHMAIQKLRNEKSHTPAKDMDKNLALHYVVLASLAYDLIDK